MKNKAIIFDRDGTLIIDKIYLNNTSDIVYLPQVFEALRLLRDAGYIFLVATNQSGVARGIVQIENLYAIHEKMRADFSREGIDILEFYYAPYMTDTNHWVRKPNPGMLERGALDYNVDLTQSWMVGDRMTDVEAGHRAGTKTVLMGDKEHPRDFDFASPEVHVTTIFEVAQSILEFDRTANQAL